MRTRNHDWLDMKRGQPRYGIQIKLADGRWLDVGSSAGVELHDTPEERDSRRAELQKQPTIDTRDAKQQR